jgi:hypothetical protein
MGNLAWLAAPSEGSVAVDRKAPEGINRLGLV